MNRRKVGFLGGMAAVIVFVFTMAACGNDPASPGSGSSDGYWNVVPVTVNGHTVTCVQYDGGYDGGISCNWDEYNGLVK